MRINDSTQCIYILYNEIEGYVIEIGDLPLKYKYNITDINIMDKKCNKYKGVAIR